MSEGLESEPKRIPGPPDSEAKGYEEPPIVDAEYEALVEHGEPNHIPEHVARFMREVVPDELLTDTRKIINQASFGFVPESRKQSSEFVTLAHEEHAKANASFVRKYLRSGKTLQDFARETSNLSEYSKRDRQVKNARIQGLTLFGAALREKYLPDTGKRQESDLDDEERQMVDVADHIVETANYLAGDYDGVKDMAGSLGFQNMARVDNFTESRETVGSSEGKESEKLRSQRWKVQVEKFNGDSGHDTIVEARKEYLERLFTHSQSEALQQEQDKLVTNARENLTLAKAADRRDTPLGVMMRAESLKVRQTANDFLKRLQSGNMTFGDLVNQGDETALRAGRLISTMFIESGYSKDGQPKSREAMSEQEKRMVDVGQMMGMECERIILEGRLHNGTLSPKQAERAYKKYRALAEHDGIPEEFKRSAQETMEKFDQRYGFTEARVVERRSEAEATPEKATPAQEEVASESSSDNEEVYNAIREKFHPIETLDQERMENFMNNIDSQVAYAQFQVDRPKSFWGKVGHRFTDLSYRFFSYREVFGTTQALKNAFRPRVMMTELAAVRGRMNKSFMEVQHERGLPKGSLDKYVSLFEAANEIVLSDLEELKNPEWEAAVAERVEREEKVRQEESEREAQEVEEVRQHVDTVVKGRKQEALRKEYVEIKDKVRAWQESNPWGEYKTFKVDQPDLFNSWNEVVTEVFTDEDAEGLWDDLRSLGKKKSLNTEGTNSKKKARKFKKTGGGKNQVV